MLFETSAHRKAEYGSLTILSFSCTHTHPAGGRRNCPAHLYQCGSGECLNPDRVCDRIVNCVDGSDEGNGCLRRNCSHLMAIRCERHCVSTPNGPVSALHGNSSALSANRSAHISSHLSSTSFLPLGRGASAPLATSSTQTLAPALTPTNVWALYTGANTSASTHRAPTPAGATPASTWSQTA